LKWIESQSDAQFELRLAKLTTPIHFGEIYTSNRSLTCSIDTVMRRGSPIT
jgi:hypothetical protein